MTSKLASENELIAHNQEIGAVLEKFSSKNINGVETVDCTSRYYSGICVRHIYILRGNFVYHFLFGHTPHFNYNINKLFSNDIEETINSIIFLDSDEELTTKEFITKDKLIKFQIQEGWNKVELENIEKNEILKQLYFEFDDLLINSKKEYNIHYKNIGTSFKLPLKSEVIEHNKNLGAVLEKFVLKEIATYKAVDMINKNPKGSYERTLFILKENIHTFQFSQNYFVDNRIDSLLSRDVEELINSITFIESDSIDENPEEFLTNDGLIAFKSKKGWFKVGKDIENSDFNSYKELYQRCDDLFVNIEKDYNITYFNKGTNIRLPSEREIIEIAAEGGAILEKFISRDIDNCKAIDITQKNPRGNYARGIYIIHENIIHLFVFHQDPHEFNRIDTLFAEDIEEMINSIKFLKIDDETIKKIVTRDNVFSFLCPSNWVRETVELNVSTENITSNGVNPVLHKCNDFFVSFKEKICFYYLYKELNNGGSSYDKLVKIYKDLARERGDTIYDFKKIYIDGVEAIDVIQKNANGAYSRCIEFSVGNNGYYFEIGNAADCPPYHKDVLFSEDVENVIKSLKFI